jgi:hypothetical protein
MRRLSVLLVAAAALGAMGCGGRAATKPLPPSGLSPAEVKRIQAASEKSHDSLDETAGGPKKKSAPAGQTLAAPTGSTAPDTTEPKDGELVARSGKVLGQDPEGCTWLEGEAVVVIGPEASRHQAHAAALEQARAAAVQDFLGISVNSKFMDFQQEGLRKDAHLTESILQTTRNGNIIKEKVLEEGFQDIPASAGAPVCPACRYHMRMKACVLPKDATADKDFRVELEVSQARFFAGDEATITVTATRDCTVYLYDVYDLGEVDKTALVIPNDAIPNKTLKAGESWTYPSDDDKKAGIHLVAELAKADQDVSAEVIRVIASKVPLRKGVYDPTDGGYLGVLSRLHRSQVEWTEDAAAYTIYKK